MSLLVDKIYENDFIISFIYLWSILLDWSNSCASIEVLPQMVILSFWDIIKLLDYILVEILNIGLSFKFPTRLPIPDKMAATTATTQIRESWCFFLVLPVLFVLCQPFKYWVDDYRIKTVPGDYNNWNNVVNGTPNLENKSKTQCEVRKDE